MILPRRTIRIRFHFEEIGKVAADGNLELKLYRLHAVVGEFNILVHTVTDAPTDRKSERARRYRAIFRCKGAIGKKYPRRIVSRGAAAEQHPGLAIGIDGPTADNARIAKKQAFLARPFNLAVQLADQDCLTLVYGDLRGADLHFERHDALHYGTTFSLLTCS